MHLARAIRLRRIERGMSQQELARRAALSRKWVVDFERGKASVELGLVMRVLSVLDLRIELGDSFMAEPRPLPPPPPVDLDALLDDLRRD